MDSKDGAGINLIKIRDFRTGAVALYGEGRRQSRAARLQGMGDVSDAVEVGLFFDYEPGNWSIAARALRDFGEKRDGFLADLTIGYSIQQNEWLEHDVECKCEFADRSRMGTFFGVTPKQAADSGLRTYRAEPGIQALETSYSLNMYLSEYWIFLCEMDYRELVGIAAKSPVPERNGQLSSLVELIYKFR